MSTLQALHQFSPQFRADFWFLSALAPHPQLPGFPYGSARGSLRPLIPAHRELLHGRTLP